MTLTVQPADPLLAAIDAQAADLVARAREVRRAAADNPDLSTLDRAGVLLELAALNAKLDALLGRVSGADDAFDFRPDGAA